MVGLYRSKDHGNWVTGLRLSVICGKIQVLA
jgi:hypothetical protein